MFSASDQTPTCRADQKSRSKIVSNKTLVGGLEAGRFSFVGVVRYVLFALKSFKNLLVPGNLVVGRKMWGGAWLNLCHLVKAIWSSEKLASGFNPRKPKVQPQNQSNVNDHVVSFPTVEFLNAFRSLFWLSFM